MKKQTSMLSSKKNTSAIVGDFFDRKLNNAKLWIDGKLVHELNANDIDKGCLANDNNQKWTFPIFEQLTLGWVDYQKGGGSRKIWIDDVILSKEKLD